MAIDDAPTAAPPAAQDSGLGWTRNAGLVAVIVGLLLAALPASPLWVVLLGLTIAVAVGVPLVVATAPGAARRLVPVAVVLVAILGAWAPHARANGTGIARDRTHDGGVTVTVEAARMALRGENPYTERYDEVLPSSWARVQGADGDLVANPVIDHEPYLPLSFLVQTPFVAAGDALGTGWDTRVLAWAALVGTVLLLATRPGPAWIRLGAVLTVGNAFTFTYLAWGTNDSLAACALVVALVLARQRPAWAGAALALAISCKFLLLVAVPPLLVVVLAEGGWRAVRRWWTAPALLAVTCLAYLAWSPGPFLDDVLWFNLGRTKPLMPTSGLGLPAAAGDVFHGPLLGLVTLIGLVIAFGLVPWLAHRFARPAWVGPLTSLALLGLLIPARTFQINYLVLVVTVAATGWWLFDREPATSH
ncbi:MAG: hypothetical protein ACTHN0_19230 [Aquihabitans sp.]